MRPRDAATLALCLVIHLPTYAAASTDQTSDARPGAAALRKPEPAIDLNQDWWRRLAATQAQAGNLDSAYTAITRAIALAPSDRDIQLARANILLWQHHLKEAQDQAAAVRAVDPAYPGLDAFDQAVGREETRTGKSGPISLALSASLARVKFPGASRQTWQSVTLGTAFGNPRSTVFELDADAESRSSIDVRISARATTRTARGAYYVGGGVTPDATFRDQWRVVAGGETFVAPRFQASIDLRLAHYREGLLTAIEPGVTYRALPVLSITAKAINLLGSDGKYRLGGAVRADYEPSSVAAFFVSAARYPDREEDGVRQLRAIALSARFDLDRHWQLRLAAVEEKRETSYRRRSASVGLAYRFAAP